MNLVLAAVALVGTFQEAGPWRLVFEGDKKRESVREDGSDRREEAAATPGGKRRLFTSSEDGDSEIWVSDPDGKNKKQLTDNKAVDYQPRWTPDGRRIVFVSSRTGDWQVWIMEADGDRQTQLTKHAAGARDPEVSPAGDRISYLEFHPERSKLPPRTLWTMDLSGKGARVLLEKVQILEHAWAPKGDRIACSLVQELRILETSSGKTLKSFKLNDVHKDLYAHAAHGMLWRPDGGAIACTITFLGGRMGDSKIFGDDQVFILPMEGKPVAIEVGGRASPLRWIR